MKRLSALIVSAILLVSTAAIPVSAFHGRSTHRSCTNTCSSFVDKDKDGICDNKEAASKKKAPAKKNTAPAKKNNAKKQPQKNFVDKNKDGLCDNAGSNTGCGRRHCRNR